VEHVFSRFDCKLDCILYLWKVYQRLQHVEVGFRCIFFIGVSVVTFTTERTVSRRRL
jgi:hypothetical protein